MYSVNPLTMIIFDIYYHPLIINQVWIKTDAVYWEYQISIQDRRVDGSHK